ncbi:MAG TPA: hypothetical protein VD902_14990, partial [Symbiobacteriaceae bacterium]|nr:hypothetical protein [Symbiobacteriaceae bacterium]
MSPRPPRAGKAKPPIALAGPMTREKLPVPLVYYPGRQGAFFAFAESRDDQPALCACAEGAVRNLFLLAPPAEEDGVQRLPPLDYGLFPDVIMKVLLGQANPLAALRFRPLLCHRCNLEAPTLRYCHEAEGQKFVQTYGWYINQSYLRLGIHPTSGRYLPEVCPPEYHDQLGRIQALTEQARAVRAQLAALMNGPRREIARSERSHWSNVTRAELAPLEAIEGQLNHPKYHLRNAVQNVTRAEFGFRPVGEFWVCETQLYRIVCRLFPDEQVLRHHRPDWLEGLELDLYLPGLKLALEYQGQQHFHPIKAWGGEQALLELQARDARKA